MTPHVVKPPDNCNHNTNRMSDEWMTYWEKVILFSHIDSRVYNWGNCIKKIPPCLIVVEFSFEIYFSSDLHDKLKKDPLKYLSSQL